MNRYAIEDRYFEWLSDIVCGNRYSKKLSYRKLLMYLHQTEFRYTILQDENRAKDGVDLRYRFAWSNGLKDEVDCLDGPCSILEMMVALAIRCEECIMDNPSNGDRTGQWFWGMIVSLKLGSMYDSRYDKHYIDDAVEKFLNRDYEPDGSGGLFVIKNCDCDLRDMPIWRQMCWFLDNIAVEV